MVKIIGSTGTGKTKELMQKAFDNRGVFLCADPIRMRCKADSYGIPVQIDSYNNLYSVNEPVYIDDLEKFLKTLNPDIAGFNLCND